DGGGWRRERAQEARLHQIDAGQLPGLVRRDERRRDLARVIGGGLVADVLPVARQWPAEITEERGALLPDRVEVHGVTLGLQRLDPAARLLDQIGVERAAETAIGGEQDDRGATGPALPDRPLSAEQREALRALRRPH